MPPWLEHNRVANNLLNLILAGARAVGSTEVDLIIAEQAEVKPPIACEAHTVACRAEWIGDSADKPQLAARPWNPVSSGGVAWVLAIDLKLAKVRLDLGD